MGSPLGPLFANFYMAHLENQVLSQFNDNEKPSIYCRYIDDIFLLVNNVSILENIRTKFSENSVLNFTFEIETLKSISFLDVDTCRSNGSFQTKVHVKSTNTGDCLNFNSITTDTYKTGVIKTMLHRAFKISSSWTTFHEEVNRLKQLFTNNNYPLKLIENQINKFINNKLSNNFPTDDNNSCINLYYRNQMSSNYKQEEINLKKIVNNHVSSVNINTTIKLSIYYKNPKLSQLFIKNNLYKDNIESNVVYKYTCNQEGCQPHQFYIGYTTTSLKQRITAHTQQGSIREHNLTTHNSKTVTAEVLNNVQVIHRSNSKQELQIAESLHIKQQKPPLNNQREGETRILQIF